MNAVDALRQRLQRIEPDALPAALAEVDGRDLAYPIGSGHGDELALRSGLRPVIRQLLGAGDLERERARLHAAGFATTLAPVPYGPTRDGWTRPEADGRRALFVGRDEARVQAAVDADLARDDRALGRLLGYPRCCVDAFLDVPRPRKNADLYRSSLAGTRSRPHPRLNMLDLRVFHLVSWSPCGYDCELSVRYADALGERIARTHPAFMARVDRALSAHRLVVLDDVQLSLAGTWDGRQLRMSEVHATARDYHPQAALEPSARMAVAELLVRLRGVGTLELTGSTLVLDGTAIGLERPPLLVPFGDHARR